MRLGRGFGCSHAQHEEICLRRFRTSRARHGRTDGGIISTVWPHLPFLQLWPLKRRTLQEMAAGSLSGHARKFSLRVVRAGGSGPSGPAAYSLAASWRCKLAITMTLSFAGCSGSKIPLSLVWRSTEKSHGSRAWFLRARRARY